MANIVRLCNPLNYKFMFEYNGKEFTGLYSAFVQDVLQEIARTSNITIDFRSRDDGVGELINGTDGLYTGCVGRIQKNESDVMLQPSNYPLPASDLTQGDIFLDSTTQFITFYYPRADTAAAQIESSFDSIGFKIWLFCLLTLMFCFGILRTNFSLRREYRKKFRRPGSQPRYLMYQIMVHMTRYGQLISASGFLEKMIFLNLSFFSFMVILYFSSLIKTELVLTTQPSILKSYQDLLDKNVGVWFVDGTDSYLEFKFAAKHTLEKQLWDSTITKFPMSTILYNADIETGKSLLEPWMLRKSAYVTESTWMPLVMKEICALSIDQNRLDVAESHINLTHIEAKSLFPFLSQDNTARAHMRGFVTNKFQTPAIIRVRKTMQRYLEGGLTGKIIDFATNTKVLDSLVSIEKTKGLVGLIQQCEGNIIYSPEVHLDRVSLSNMKNVFILITCSVFLHLFILITEVVGKSTSRHRDFRVK